MTKTELRARLLAENIPPDLYSLDGGLPGEKLCLSNTGAKWEVYYSERGQYNLFLTLDCSHKTANPYLALKVCSQLYFAPTVRCCPAFHGDM